MKKLIIFIAVFGLFNLSLYGFRVREKEITIWTTVHSHRFDGDKRWETDDTYVSESDFIRKSPIAIKTIIAYFSQYIDFDKNNELTLAKALGNFSTLQKARENLLHKKENIFKNIEIEGEGYANLVISIEGNIVSFIFSNPWGNHTKTYKFRINKKGDIKYID